MDYKTVRRAAVTSAVALLWATGLTSAALAQEAPAAPPADAPVTTTAVSEAPGAVVQRIVVEGNERIETNTILTYLPVTAGETVDPSKIDLSIKALFRTDLFSDVQVGVIGSDLVVRVVENPIVNQVAFEGNKAVKEDKLREEVQVRPRGIFTRAKVEADVQRILELYRRSGKIGAVVTPKIVQLPQKRVDLVYEIDEGPKSGILNVNIVGNQAFSDGDLKDEMVTEESKWYRFFSSNDNYDPDRLEYDKEQLRKFYRNRGYYDFQVVSGVAELEPSENDFAVTLTVNEGPRYRFGKVQVATNLKRLDPKLLEQLLPLKSGEVYSDQRVEKATDALTFAAGASGFAFVDVRPRYQANLETKTVDVTFDVREGPRAYIERIDVVGNTRTLDYVVRRALPLSEGDAYNRILVERSKSAVRGLGFFKDVDIQQVPGSAPDKIVLLVKVTEQPTGEFTFSVGYSSVDQIIGDVGITERNFRGRGQIVNFRLSAGSLRQQIDFSFTEPRFLGRNLAAGLDLYTYKYNFSEQAAFNSSSTGASVRLTFPLSSFMQISPRYTIKSDSIEVSDYLCVVDLNGETAISRSICDQRGAKITSALGYSLRWEGRNDLINPTRGFFVDLRQDLAGVGGEVRYIRTETTAGFYHSFAPKWTLSATAASGYISGWGGEDIRINDRFFKGGTTFRGFDIAGIGPRDVVIDSTTKKMSGSALGGKLYAIGSLELTLPIPVPEQYGLKFAAFSDVGTLGMVDESVKLNPDGTPDTSIRDDLGLRASVGLSVFWRSPMGPLRFDLSQVLAKEEYDDPQTFRFSTSTRF